MDWLDHYINVTLAFIFRPDGGFYFFLLVLLIAIFIVQLAQRRDEKLVEFLFFGPTLSVYGYIGVLRVLLGISERPDKLEPILLGQISGQIALFLVLWLVVSAAILMVHRRWKIDKEKPILRVVMLGVLANGLGLTLVGLAAFIVSRFGRG